MLKVGLIGCGGMGGVHASSYEQLEKKVKIVAVADVQEEKRTQMSKKYECDAYESGMDLIENADVDFVDICVPTYLHTELAVAAMEKGFDVFIEKPLCMTREEGFLLCKTQAKTGRKAQVGQVVRFMNEWKWLKATIDEKKFGNLNFLRLFRLSPTPVWGWEDWFMDPMKSGGAPLDLQLHDVDYMRYVFGDEVKKMTSVSSNNKDGRVDHIISCYDYDGTMVVVEGGWDLKAGAPFSAGYEAYFEDATVILRDGKLNVYRDGKAELIDFTEPEAIDVGINLKAGSAYAAELEYFIDNVIPGTGEEIAPIIEGLKSVQYVFDEIEMCKGAIKKCL